MSRRRGCFFASFFSPLLIVSIGVGSAPAYALRPMQDTAGLEDALADSSPPAIAPAGVLARPQDLIASDLRDALGLAVRVAYAQHLPQIAAVIDSTYQDDPQRDVRMPQMIQAVSKAQTLMFDRLGKKGHKAFHEALLPSGISVYRAAPEFLIEAVGILRTRIPSDAPGALRKFFDDARTVIEGLDFDLLEWRNDSNIALVAKSLRSLANQADQMRQVHETLQNGEPTDIPTVPSPAHRDGLPSPVEQFYPEQGEWEAYLLKHLPGLFFQKLQREAPEEAEEFLKLFDAIGARLREIETISQRLGAPSFFRMRRDRLEALTLGAVKKYVETASHVYARLSRQSIKLTMQHLLEQFDQDVRFNRARDAWGIVQELPPGEGLVSSAELTVTKGGGYEYFPGLINLGDATQKVSPVTVRVVGQIFTLLDQENRYLTRRISASPLGVVGSAAVLLADGPVEGIFKVPVDDQGRVVLYHREGIRATRVTFQPTVLLPKGGTVFLTAKQGGDSPFTMKIGGAWAGCGSQPFGSACKFRPKPRLATSTSCASFTQVNPSISNHTGDILKAR